MSSAKEGVFASKHGANSPAGIWSPGMRLLGRVSFPVKALVICLCFLVPLTWLGWSFFSAKNASIEFSAKERLGVEYNRAIFPVLDMAQQLRREATASAASGQAPASLAEAKNRLVQAQQSLVAADKRLGAALGTAKALSAMQAAFAATESAKGLEQTFATHTAHIDTVLGLLVQATDGSNLTLDPDLVSYYLMDAAFFRIPDIVESSGKLRGLGLAVMKAGQATPAQRQMLSETIPIAEFQFRNMGDGLAKVYGADATLKTKLRSDDPLADSKAFFELVRNNVINGEQYAESDQAALLASGNKTIGGQYELAKRLIDELDLALKTRVDGLVTELWVALGVLVISVLVAAYAFYCFYLVSSGGLTQMALHLGEMSTGDLRHRPAKPWASDETGAVLMDLATTYEALHGLIRKVRHGARELHTASNEIASASTDLAARTEASAAALEEQASAMEQIASTVGNTANNAQQAAQFASENAQVAVRGGEVIAQVVSTMQGIHTSSSKINDIIGVIDGIAFQTNILALNAAVEAARAGEAGRGFAVVASEVRQLAQRSAGAAKEIKTLIGESVLQVEAGTRVVQGAGATMTEVVANARQMNVLLSEIATSAKEQAVGVEQVGQSIQDLDRTTQQNAALVEQTTAAASALREQADVLQQEIANFRVA